MLKAKTAVIQSMLATMFVASCASASLGPEELANVEWGPYPEDFESRTKTYMDGKLKDPSSAKYRFENPPYKAYVRKAPIQGGKPFAYGYMVDFWVNARNGFGGYTGDKFYRVLISGDLVYGPVGVNEWFSEPWYRGGASKTVGLGAADAEDYEMLKLQTQKDLVAQFPAPPNDGGYPAMERLKAIQNGMTPRAVLELLGNPASRVEGSTIVWTYGDSQSSLVLTFVDGKLTNYTIPVM